MGMGVQSLGSLPERYQISNGQSDQTGRRWLMEAARASSLLVFSAL